MKFRGRLYEGYTDINQWKTKSGPVWMTPWNQIGVGDGTESGSVDGRDSADGTTESG